MLLKNHKTCCRKQCFSNGITIRLISVTFCTPIAHSGRPVRNGQTPLSNSIASQNGKKGPEFYSLSIVLSTIILTETASIMDVDRSHQLNSASIFTTKMKKAPLKQAPT